MSEPHKCDKNIDDYIILQFKQTNDWYIEIDEKSAILIYNCPFCGIQLTRENYKGSRPINEKDIDDWIDGFFLGDGT